MKRLVSEPLTPLFGADDPAPSGGDPRLPRRFRWRDDTLEVAVVESQWKDTAPCRNGSGERYRRRHWYDLRSTDGRRLRVYFDRREPNPKKKWWVFSESTTD